VKWFQKNKPQNFGNQIKIFHGFLTGGGEAGERAVAF